MFKGERWKADVIAAALEADGLEAQVFDDQPIGTILDAQVLVPEGQVARAKRLIEEAESAPLEPDGEDEAGGASEGEV